MQTIIRVNKSPVNWKVKDRAFAGWRSRGEYFDGHVLLITSNIGYNNSIDAYTKVENIGFCTRITLGEKPWKSLILLRLKKNIKG